MKTWRRITERERKRERENRERERERDRDRAQEVLAKMIARESHMLSWPDLNLEPSMLSTSDVVQLVVHYRSNLYRHWSAHSDEQTS